MNSCEFKYHHKQYCNCNCNYCNWFLFSCSYFFSLSLFYVCLLTSIFPLSTFFMVISFCILPSPVSDLHLFNPGFISSCLPSISCQCVCSVFVFPVVTHAPVFGLVLFSFFNLVFLSFLKKSFWCFFASPNKTGSCHLLSWLCILSLSCIYSQLQLFKQPSSVQPHIKSHIYLCYNIICPTTSWKRYLI